MTLYGAIGSLQPTPQDAPAVATALRIMANSPEQMLAQPASDYPSMCIDGRPYASHPKSHAPQVAGGTLTTWVADLLLTKIFQSSVLGARNTGYGLGELSRDYSGPPATASLHSQAAPNTEVHNALATWLANTCDALRQAGLPVSDHRADSHGPGAAGCGAADSLGAILHLLGKRPEGITTILSRWGIDPRKVPVDALDHASRLASEVPSGEELVQILANYSTERIPVVTGPHREVAVVANTRAHTVIRRDAITGALASASIPSQSDASGAQNASPTGHPQAFCVDVWALPEISTFLTNTASAHEIELHWTPEQITATAAAFNAAAILVLCGPEAQDIVL
ncbi:hypothetical protein [Ancrocorticia sp.]|uniref:hypothetical protein n=1 Tax=Ancrocorticia sp. TaxID=2593684 RepID=UPI003F8FB570